ncbi:MAG: 30S ribosomal protein S16 [Kiritimatiellales bacterium]|nr:30S ribosomal protein S16 [Kiritimatiellales bacterium]
MLVLRLQRTGKRNDATFRIVAADKRAAVKGKFLEVIGHYLPTRNPVVFECDQERVSHWISKGAQPSDTLARLLGKQGMAGLEKFVDSYTKKKKKKEVPEEAAPAPAPAAAEEASAEPVVEEKPAESEAPKEAEAEPAAEEVKEEAPAEEAPAPYEAKEELAAEEKKPEEEEAPAVDEEKKEE